MSKTTSITDIDGDKVTFEPQSWAGFKISTNHCHRAFQNNKGPAVALAVLEACGYGNSNAARVLDTLVETVSTHPDYQTNPELDRESIVDAEVLPAEYTQAIDDLNLPEAEKQQLLNRETVAYQESLAKHSNLEDGFADAVRTALDALTKAGVRQREHDRSRYGTPASLEHAACILTEWVDVDERAAQAEADRRALEAEALRLHNIAYPHDVQVFVEDLGEDLLNQWVNVARAAREIHGGGSK